LSDRFRLLTGGRGRHQTLRSTMDWSYGLLSEDERALFRRLSVFAGGYDLQAVEAICGDSLDTIEHLVDKSLVIVEQLSDERLRYRLLETLRHYAAERLVEAGEEEDARERHFIYYLDVAERTYARRIEDEAASLALLDADHDDFRAALRWARARPLADRSLELWQENGEPLELALALESIGYSQFMAGEYADALRSMEDCLEQYRKFGSAKLVTRGRVNVGQMLVALGDVERTE